MARQIDTTNVLHAMRKALDGTTISNSWQEFLPLECLVSCEA